MDKPPPQRGGAGRGQGRKPISDDSDRISYRFRLTSNQRDKIERCGGAAWLRSLIDAAPDHAPPEPEIPR